MRIPIAVSMVAAGAFFFSIKTRLSGYVKYGLEALFWNLAVLRSTLAERRLIQHKRIETDAEIEKAMCRGSMDICALKRRLS